MNDEQIKEVMRLADELADACAGCDSSHFALGQRAALEAYLRTISEPENTFPLNPNGASKWAHLQKHDGAQAIGVVFRTGSGSVGSLVDGRVVWADWLAHPNGSKPESVNAELLEALKDARHCIGIDRDTLVDCHTNPCTGYLDPDGALAKAEYDDVIDAADAAIARAESAIETPTKVSPCAGHAVQQDADASRDWPEDFPHENGQYMNTCHVCKNTFIGHKRRVVCKVCNNGFIRAQKEADETRACETCGGRGEVGGFVGGGAPGYETHPCPDCRANDAGGAA
jgi:hypothetical protein